ncbi:hypothetical protein JCM10212_006468 [Sporobolomyces blumeae]
MSEQPEVKPEQQHVALKVRIPLSLHSTAAKDGAPTVSSAANDREQIQGSGFPELVIKVKKTTRLEKMMNAYCQRAGKDLSEVRFMYDGTKLAPTQTVSELDFDDDDDEIIIDVAQEAVGGSN